MKNNKGFAGLGILIVILIAAAVGGGVYYKNKNTVSVKENTESENTYHPVVEDKTSAPSKTSGTVNTQTNVNVSVPAVNVNTGVNVTSTPTQSWSVLPINQSGIGQSIKYPSNWIVIPMNGGSYGTNSSVVGVTLKPSATSSDSISIGGWQYDCSAVNVSGGNNPSTKAYCIQTDANFFGTNITSSNQGTIHGIPMVTSSTNAQVLNMFDLIVQNNL